MSLAFHESRRSEHVLIEDQHVLAAAPGENAFLVRVESMLIAHQAVVPLLLRPGGR